LELDNRQSSDRCLSCRGPSHVERECGYRERKKAAMESDANTVDTTPISGTFAM
jgi:hypothetical protein